MSGVAAAAFAPLAVTGNVVVNTAFSNAQTTGVTGFIAQFASNFAMGGSISLIQYVIELFCEVIVP